MPIPYAKHAWPRYTALLATLILAAVLRLTGITWGLPTPELPILLHPDEIRVIGALASVDIAKGEYTPPLGHMDGMLTYYLWTGALGAAKAIGLINVYANRTNVGDEQYSKMVLIGRLVVVTFDLASIILVYATLRRMRVRAIFSLLGAAVLTVTPIEMVYSHYMRPHVVSNFFVTLTIFSTLVMLQSLRIRWRALTGFVCGLAAASMYPAILTIMIPLSAMVYEELVQKHKVLFFPLAIGKVVLNRNIAALALATVAGFFISDPMLFLDFQTALGPLAVQWKEAANFNQIGSSFVSQMNKIGTYLVILIPNGTGPYLWVLLYSSFFIALLCKRRRAFVIVLNIFVLLVLYLMGTSYFNRAEFVRTIIMVFPPLAILSGLALSTLWEWLKYTWAKMALIGFLFFLLGNSLFFDAAYVQGMTNLDPRLKILNYFREIPPGPPWRIGVVVTSWMSETLASPLRFLEAEGKAVITPIYPDTPRGIIDAQDYLCFIEFMLGDNAANRDQLRRFEVENRFQLDQVFRNRLSFAGIGFDNKELAHDMAYPFPKFFLFRSININGAP